MLKFSAQFLSKTLLIVLLPLSAQASWAGNRDAVVGGALGGVIGSIVGSQIGGRDGAIVGAGIGAAAGVAITANHDRRHNRYERVQYVDERCRDDYRGGYRGHDYRERGYREDRGYYADRGWREEYRPRYYH
ncbi:MAG: glycine zipper domain-containing protein [Spongiibacteraceae bacterium]